MEMLVVLTIFSTVVVVATNIFMLASRSQRKVFGLERIQADARYTMESMVREIRTGTIDYGYYAGRSTPLGLPDGELALVDSTKTTMLFKESDSTDQDRCPDATSVPCLLVSVGGAAPEPVTPKGVMVRNVRFYISPQADPFTFDTGTGTYPSNVQPSVTIVLALESTATKAADRSLVYFQTTASNRTYRR